VTTGISAADRATTIRTAVADQAKAEDIVSPGHVFPIRARKGGVLVRTGQTEGSVDLARLAGLKPAGVICEIMKDDGTMARMPDLEVFAAEHHLKIATIADLINFRMQHESMIHRKATAHLPTHHGDFG
jgi:3,4-dihydroxy 2-butanone 4-phosphate synthase/GTP cyclohydrolase II